MSDTRIVQRGIAKIQTTAGALDAYVGIAIQTVKGKHAWDNQNVKDFGGFEFGWDARNAHIIITISAKLTAASQAVAITNGAFLLELAEVALSGFDLPWLNTTGVGGYFTGHWCYHEGGSIDLSNEQAGGIEISLRKFKDPTQNAAQFTIPA
jgi:hypothetical protein